MKDKSKLQEKLDSIYKFTVENVMKVNDTKSKVMIFNRSKNFDFPPELNFNGGSYLECLEESRLLGVMLQSNLKWNSNTSAIYKKAMNRMWLLRRMKVVKLDSEIILDYFMKEIRPLAEHAVPIWNSGLTKMQIKDLEKIQKVALYIIYGKSDMPYSQRCKLLGLKTLEERRLELCTNFAVKLFKSPRRDEFFTLAPPGPNTRHSRVLVKENLTRTSIAFNAPHNYLSRLINQYSGNLV